MHVHGTLSYNTVHCIHICTTVKTAHGSKLLFTKIWRGSKHRAGPQCITVKTQICTGSYAGTDGTAQHSTAQHSTAQQWADLWVAASLAQAQQREQQLLLLSSSQPAVACHPLQTPLGSLAQQLGGDGGGCPGGAVSMLPAVEVALDGAEVQAGGVLVLGW